MDNGLFGTIYNPDVLSCLANLSNDEVFTPPDIVNQMLDMLPQELFSNPDITFLDPACKTGVYLREIAKRLLKGLEPQIPDLQERIDHIFQKQLYGIAITELTSLLARRSVYCSKYPNSEFSVTKFDDRHAQGNIRFKRIAHGWQNGKCVFCGASQSEYDRDESLETHAYEWIHTMAPERIFDMKFDVIIGNPPYQLSDGGAQASAKPIYQHFVGQAKKLKPRHLAMIIPARWYAGGKGLDDFRSEMLNDPNLKELHDFPNTDDCFPGVNIRGGVCYFHWSSEYDNSVEKVKVVTHDKEKEYVEHRDLNYGGLGIFIRHGQALSILTKVTNICKSNVMMNYVSTLRPFGFRGYFVTDARFRADSTGLKKPVVCYGKGKQAGYVEESEVTVHPEWIDCWKLYTPRANNIGTELNDDNLNSFIGKPGTICTESYLAVGVNLFSSERECINASNYLKTKFVRFLHSLAKSSQDATSKTWRFIPVLDFSQEWTDERLYRMYGLTQDEIDFIESMIKPME